MATHLDESIILLTQIIEKSEKYILKADAIIDDIKINYVNGKPGRISIATIYRFLIKTNKELIAISGLEFGIDAFYLTLPDGDKTSHFVTKVINRLIIRLENLTDALLNIETNIEAACKEVFAFNDQNEKDLPILKGIMDINIIPDRIFDIYIKPKKNIGFSFKVENKTFIYTGSREAVEERIKNAEFDRKISELRFLLTGNSQPDDIGIPKELNKIIYLINKLANNLAVPRAKLLAFKATINSFSSSNSELESLSKVKESRKGVRDTTGLFIIPATKNKLYDELCKFVDEKDHLILEKLIFEEIEPAAPIVITGSVTKFGFAFVSTGSVPENGGEFLSKQIEKKFLRKVKGEIINFELSYLVKKLRPSSRQK